MVPARGYLHTWARYLARFYRWAVRAVHIVIFAIAGLSAFLLRFEFAIPRSEHLHLLWGICAWVLAKSMAFHLLGLDRGWWRYVSIPDFVRVGYANLLGSAAAAGILAWYGPKGFPRSIYILDLLLSFLLTAGTRLAWRMALEFSRSPHARRKRALIYGAGSAGIGLLRELRHNRALGYEVIGFVDDDPRKARARVQGTLILGSGAALPAVARAHGIDLVLIAMPSANGRQMSAILKRCHEAGVAYKTVPGLAEVIESGGMAPHIRDVAVEDLLGRNPIELDESKIRAAIENQVVAVTGAAGSIGSELCRQIARFGPSRIVAYECAETPLFYLEREMREKYARVPLIPEIGSVQNRGRLDEVMARHRPSILYHAAAYKHVPMMEGQPFEAIENNIFGTLNAACAAGDNGVCNFVMISSDKAVRPTNVMGASKRIAELVVRSQQNGATKFVSVRFGNVLGSNGSVIPIFKAQIAAGGPVQVTHPEMRRYFMTIPEAAQLVLQASTMGQGGEIFVLDMGTPVKIVDLALNLILLSGLRPGVDIKIEFTGLRPGEKLFEELNTIEEGTVATYHEKIKIFNGDGLAAEDLAAHLETLADVCRRRDTRRLIMELKTLVPDYNPSAELLGRVLGPVVRPVAAKAMAAAAGAQFGSFRNEHV